MSEERAEWLEKKERGSPWILSTTFKIARFVGRGPMKPLVHAVALWYRLFDRKTSGASRAWLKRVTGEEPSFWEVYRHLRVFAQVTLDRMFLLCGSLDAFTFTRNGNEHLQAQLATGRGAVLLGAHVGSYEAMRASGSVEDIPIKILGYFKNAQQINALLAELNPGQAARVIHIGEDVMSATMQAQGAIERGELVALLGDRVGLNARVVEAEFFGQTASFPAGPFLLASLLKCPVYLVFGLYSDPNRYDLYCIPFAEKLDLPRKSRETSLQEVVQRFATELEQTCRRAPLNWFNFFDFWRKP